MFMKINISVALAAILAVTGATVTSVLASEIRVSYETSDTHLKARTVGVFKEELEKATEGKVTVSTYPNSSLIPSRQEVTAVIRGQIEAIVPFVSYYEAITPKAKLLSTPLVFSSYEHLTAAMDGKVGEAIYADLEAAGMKPLAFWYETPTLIFSAQKKLATLEDVKGMKIRTYPSQTLEAMLETLGANPAVIPGNEIYVALVNGTVDGAITTPSFALSLKLDEVLKHAIDVKVVLGGYVFAMNKRFFDGLSEDEQAAVLAAAKAATEWNKTSIVSEIDDSLAKMREGGFELTSVDADEAKRWQDAMEAVYEGLDPELRQLLEVAKTYQ